MIATATDIRTYLPSVNIKTGSTRLNEYLAVAQAEIVYKILGTDIETTLETAVADGETDTHLLLRTLVKRAICVSAFADAIPELDVQMSEAGFVVASNEAVSPASKERVNSLREAVKDRRTAAFDSLVNYLMSHSDTDNSLYEDWRGTSQFTYLTQSMIWTVDLFKKRLVGVYNKDNVKLSWDDFYHMQPRMKHAMDTVVAQYVSKEYLAELIEDVRDAESLSATESGALYLIQCAIVAGGIGDLRLAEKMAREARALMLDNISEFPTFKSSSVYSLPTTDISGYGGVANFI